LDQAEEGKYFDLSLQRIVIVTAYTSSIDALHASRLLNVEEKLFKRLTKRLLAPDSLILNPPTLPPTPPDAAGADEESAAREAEIRRLEQQRRQWREDMFLDFAAFDSNVVRAQFLLNSNERERDRYGAEKIRIQETAQAVKLNNTQLRERLKEAQTTLALRKSYDELAEKITSNHLLRPRDEQQVQLEKLNAEIAELEKESSDYAKTWAERRDQFGKIVEEGLQMLRLIKDEKEDTEDMEDGDEAGLEDSKERGSRAETPRSSGDAVTPLKDVGEEGETETKYQSFLDPPISASNSRDVSPAIRVPEDLFREQDSDMQMTESLEASAKDHVEAGFEAEEGEEPGEQMDTT